MHGEAAYPLHAYGHGWDEFEKIKVGYLNNNHLPLSQPRSRKISTNVEGKSVVSGVLIRLAKYKLLVRRLFFVFRAKNETKILVLILV
jgi:hypothetical protein